MPGIDYLPLTPPPECAMFTYLPSPRRDPNQPSISPLLPNVTEPSATISHLSKHTCSHATWRYYHGRWWGKESTTSQPPKGAWEVCLRSASCIGSQVINLQVGSGRTEEDPTGGVLLHVCTPLDYLGTYLPFVALPQSLEAVLAVGDKYLHMSKY